MKHPKGAKIYTLYPGTGNDRQFSRAEWLELLEENGGYEAVEKNFYEQTEEMGFILPWGV